MRVAVTGATGLIGSELIKELRGRAVVRGLTRGNNTDILYHTDYSLESLTSIFESVDVVVHLAAVRGQGSDYMHFMDNALLTENVLKASIQANIHKVIYMSSIAVYSNVNLVPWKEDQLVSPQTFYGLSKITGEHLCELYSRKGIDYIIFRCGIVLGITNNNRMTDIFIQRAAEQKTIAVKGKSRAKRDFIYLKDVVRALSWGIFSKQNKNQVYNLGSNRAYTNLEVAKEINHAFENDGNLLYLDNCSEGLNDSRMDSSKLKMAGFQLRYDLSSALADIRKEWKINEYALQKCNKKTV